MARLALTKPGDFLRWSTFITGLTQPGVGEVVLKGEVSDEESQVFGASFWDSEVHIKEKFKSYFTLDVYLLKYTRLVNTGSMLTSWTGTGTDGLDGKMSEKKRNKTTIVGSHSKHTARDIGIHTILALQDLQL